MRWIGTFPLKRSLIIFFGAAVLGAIATVATGGEPGSLLGLLIVAGAVIAALGIERRHLYLLFPMPALAYLVLSVLTGLIHDGLSANSATQLGLNFLQWIGDGFFAMCAATILIGVIFGARMLAARQLVSGSFPMSERGPAPARTPGSLRSSSERSEDRRRSERAPRHGEDAWYDAPRSARRRDSRNRLAEDRDDTDDTCWNTDGWRISSRLPADRTPRDNRDARDTRVSRDSRVSRGGASFTPRSSRNS